MVALATNCLFLSISFCQISELSLIEIDFIREEEKVCTNFIFLTSYGDSIHKLFVFVCFKLRSNFNLFFSRMEEPLESYNQAQRATTTILNTSHPAEHINFFTARPPTSSMNSQVIKIDSKCSKLFRLVKNGRNMSKLV